MALSADLDFQQPGIVIGKLSFSLVILKTDFVASKEVTLYNHFYEERFIGELNENVSIYLFILYSSVS